MNCELKDLGMSLESTQELIKYNQDLHMIVI